MTTSEELKSQAQFIPQSPARARLKWFNSTRGFGFVVPVDSEIDAFLHVTTLQNAGVKAIGEGAELLCEINYGPKGAIVQEIVEVIDQGNIDGQSVHQFCEDSQHKSMNGTVKWYKQDKGFGFIVPDDGQKDVFVHKSCLERNGIETLDAGDTVRMTIKEVTKGREAVNVTILNRV